MYIVYIYIIGIYKDADVGENYKQMYTILAIVKQTTQWLKKTGPLLHLAYCWQVQSNNNIFWHKISLFIYKLIVKTTR